jgi:hypothetical protein
MARPSRAFELAWNSLHGTTDAPGWQLIGIDPSGPIAIKAGRRFPGNEEAVLASFPKGSLPAAEKLPDGQGFAVEWADLHGDAGGWLALARRPHGSPELFTAMACDVVGAMDAEVIAGADTHRLLRIFLGRVRAWQEFMRKGAQTLSAEAEIGLFGELATLASMIDVGASAHAAIGAWVGPLDSSPRWLLSAFPLGLVHWSNSMTLCGSPCSSPHVVSNKSQVGRPCPTWWRRCGLGSQPTRKP